MLHRVGMTPTVLQPAQFRTVMAYGVGLTDIVKKTFGADVGLRATDFDRDGLMLRIETYQPAIFAFNGKRAASVFFGGPVEYGYQRGSDIGRTRIYVAPSTSGAARRFWDEGFWRQVAEAALEKNITS
jgi:TDG/mug DNA glycosylase family protein